MVINLVVFDNDASGCYDRIIVALGMIAALHLRMPRGAIRMHARALANMKYFVKTAHGILEAFYRAVLTLKVVAHPHLYGSRWWSAFFRL
jgi:hypothetical protein